MYLNYTTNPGYIDLVLDTYKTVIWYHRKENWNGYSFPKGLIDEFNQYYHLPLNEAYPIFIIGILFTIIRYLFEYFICRPFVNWSRIDKESDRKKFPESCWKFTAYTVLWTYCSYLIVFSGKYDYFTKSYEIWDGIKFFIQI